MSSDTGVKFAYWVPNVSGGVVISKIEQRTSHDIGYDVKLAQTAERSGFDYAADHRLRRRVRLRQLSRRDGQDR